MKHSNLTTLRWRAITRPTTPSTTTGKATVALWKVKSSQRYWQRLEDRKRWEIEKLHRTSTPNISTRLPIGILDEDDIYYDNIRPGAAKCPTVNLAKLRERLEEITASYQVGSFENLSYKSKKNAMRASIKRQRILDEYYSRKFSMSTLEPPTRRPWNFLHVSSARYYWGNVQHTFQIHYMNSSEAYEDDKQEFYARLRLNKKPKPSTSSTTAAAIISTDAMSPTKPKKIKAEKTKKTKPPGPSTTTRPQTDFPIPLMNGSYEEWVTWRKELEEANNIISWYSDTSERIAWYKQNKSLHTKAPIEQPGVYYESTDNDYPVNCSLSLETDVPPPEVQWKQYVTWQKKHFTRRDLTIESVEEPPYAKLPFDLRTTLDSRFHQTTLVPRKTSPRILIDSSEEWHKLNRAIPRNTRYPEPPPGGPTKKKSNRKRRSVNDHERRLSNDTDPNAEKAFEKIRLSRNNILNPIENILDAQNIKNKILADLNNLQNLQFSFRKKYSGGYIGSKPKDNSKGEGDQTLPENQEADTDNNDDGSNGDTTEKDNENLVNNQESDHRDYGKNEDTMESANENDNVHIDRDNSDNVKDGNNVKHSVDIKTQTTPTLLDLNRLIRHLENLKLKGDAKQIDTNTYNGKTIDNSNVISENKDEDRQNDKSSNGNIEAKSEKLDERKYTMMENTKMLIQYLEGKHNKQIEEPGKQIKNENTHPSKSKHLKITKNNSLLDRANRVEFKNNLMDMPEMIELKQYISDLKKINENNMGEHIINEMMNGDLSSSDVVHDLKKVFGIFERNTTSFGVTDVTLDVKDNQTKLTTNLQDEELSSMTDENYGDKKPVLFAGEIGEVTNVSSTIKSSFKTIPRNDISSNGSAKDTTAKETSIDDQDIEKLNVPVDNINYDINSNLINNPANGLNDEAVETINNEYEIKQTKSQSKLQMTNILLTLYNLVIDILKATFTCIDIVVKEFGNIKGQIREEYVELKQKAHELIKTVVLCLEVEESVINLIKYTRLQENYTNPRLSLHRLRRFVCANPIIREASDINRMEVMNGGKIDSQKVTETCMSHKFNDADAKKVPDTIKNEAILQKTNANNVFNDLSKDKQNGNENFPNSNRPRTQSEKGLIPEIQKVGAFFQQIWSRLQNKKPVHFGQYVRLPSEISQHFLRLNHGGSVKHAQHKHRRRRNDPGRQKRDVVYTYSDESTIDPDDQWYIDLAAREFVQGRDLRDPKFNRSKIIKNMKRAGIFSVDNFSMECLSNQTWPTIEPPTTWSRNFSSKYRPSPFWNWTRYLEVHYSFMDFLFGTGTPFTTKKTKRNLSAKRLRAHQAFMEYKMRKAGNWTGGVTLLPPTTPQKNRSKIEDSEELNSELRRISSIVWSYTETTDPGGRLYTKKKKKKTKKGDKKESESEDDVYDHRFEDNIPNTTAHIADWDYANRMFRHWGNIRNN
uniref:Uncharacterized protein n=1 Tax=Cacopsylla melanoneura TaxID=428564 RepID=A0A8D8XHU1_9HEMI